MNRTIKGVVSVFAVVLLLAGCTAAPGAAPTPEPIDSEKAALEDQVDVLVGKVEQLQDRVDDLQKENAALQNDSTVSVADNMTYLLDIISDSGQTLTSFPALVSGITASGEGYMLTIDRLEYNPEVETGEGQGGPYLLNAEVSPEDVYADHFVYVYYDNYLMPEMDEGFGDYIKGGDGVRFIVYMLGDQVIFLSEVLVP